MQPTFVITNPLQQLTLDKGRGELTWTVTNTTAREVRGRLDLDIDIRQGIEADWFSVEEPVVRVFGPNETSAVTVTVEVPEDVDDQQPRLSLTASNVEHPQEDYQIGPAVCVRGIHWIEGERPVPWYLRRWFIITACCLIVLLVGLMIGGIISWVNRDRLKDKTLTEALVYVHRKDLDLGDVRWAFDPNIRDKVILPSGTVLESSIKDDEVSLLIQLWHTFDSADALGFTRKQRAEHVESINARIEGLKANPLPLSNWIEFEDEEEITKAKEKAVPIDFLKTSYQVEFSEEFVPPKK